MLSPQLLQLAKRHTRAGGYPERWKSYANLDFSPPSRGQALRVSPFARGNDGYVFHLSMLWTSPEEFMASQIVDAASCKRSFKKGIFFCL